MAVRSRHLRHTLRQLECFVAVGDAGTIAGAAAALGVSSPSVSSAVAQFEHEMGIQLFVRQHARGLILTRAGRRLLTEARQALTQAGRLRSIAADIIGNIAGPLNLGCLQTIAPFVLPKLRRQFEQQYPDVQVYQTATHQAALLEGLQNGHFDLCLTYNLDIPANVNFDGLAELPVYVMLPLSHPLAKQKSVRPQELAKEKMILLDLPMSAKYFLSMFHRAGIKPNIAERSTDMALVRSLVANGFGYSLGNIHPQRNTAPDGTPLKCVPLHDGLRPMQMGLAGRQDAAKTGVVDAFQACCRKMMRGGFTPWVFGG